MKKFTKVLLSVLLVGVIAATSLVAFAACNDTSNQETLYVATNCEFEPFEYLDADGNPTGIDMDIAKALADKLGMKISIKDMAFDSVVSSVASGSCSIAMAGLTVTEERKQSVDFTQTYFSSSQVVIAKSGNSILNITAASDSKADINAAIASVESALEGKSIGVQNGTTGYSYVSGNSDDYDGISGATTKGYASGALAVQALLNNQVDYVVIDAVPASKLVAANSGIAASTVVLTGEDYAFAVKKGDSALLTRVNEAITALIADGTIDSIFTKYNVASGLNA